MSAHSLLLHKTTLTEQGLEIRQKPYRSGLDFMELLKPHILLKHKMPCFIRSASRLKFLVWKERAENKSKAIHLTTQLGLYACLHKDYFFILRRNIRFKDTVPCQCGQHYCNPCRNPCNLDFVSFCCIDREEKEANDSPAGRWRRTEVIANRCLS